MAMKILVYLWCDACQGQPEMKLVVAYREDGDNVRHYVCPTCKRSIMLNVHVNLTDD